jgi:cyclophilin family peptidyl-prolyl cis-trans isomerase
MKAPISLSIIWLTTVILLLTGSCKPDEEEVPATTTEESDTLVELTTDHGTIMMWLYPETPLHRRNFFELVQSGFYDSTEFHRVVKDFVIQGGDPLSKDADRSNDGTGGPGYTIPAEIDSTRFRHHYGAIGAARTGDRFNPERASSGSQFYIVVNPLGTDFLDGAYTVFGKVVGKMDMADRIAQVNVNDDDLPDKRIPCGMRLVEVPRSELTDKYGIQFNP